jgi:uncharacterized protein
MTHTPAFGIDAAPLTENALASLPVFPLPNCVLLPGGLLPLHVFEPRYRAMTKDCLDGNQLMGIANTQAALSVENDMPPVLCVGQIVCSEELADGRYMILLRGVARVKAVSELPEVSGYRRFCCQLVSEQHCPAGTDAVLHQELITLCGLIAPLLKDGGEQLKELAKRGPPGFCADAIAAAILAECTQRQQMLDNANVTERLQLARHHLQTLLCELMPCDSSSVN